MNQAQNINRLKVAQLLSKYHGEFFSAVFEKKDGSIRTILAQIRPPKPNPKRPSPATNENPYILVGDVKIYKAEIAKGATPEVAYNASYRLISLATLREFKLHGTHYTVTD